MPYVDIDSRDGTFKVTVVPRETADARMQQGHEVAYVEDAVFDAWLKHESERAAYNKLWIMIQNEMQHRNEVYELRHKIDMLEKYGPTKEKP